MLEQAGARPPEFFAAEIREQIPAFGLALESSRVLQLAQYLAELDLWRRRTNLTGSLSAEELVAHALESAFGEKLIPHGKRLIDIGSGAGLPGMPLAIARPDLSVTLLEPRGKRAAFLRHVTRTVPIENVQVLEERLERLAEPRYDVATTRAVGGLAEMINGASFLGLAGVLLAWTTDPRALADSLVRLFTLEAIEPIPASRRRVLALFRRQRAPQGL